MDGNSRWAEREGLPRFRGHEEGKNNLKRVAEWCLDRGIQILTVYAFSTENWKRSKEEISFLMELLKKTLRDELDELHNKNIRIIVLGRISDFSEEIQKILRDAMEKTKNNTRGILNLCLSYGGRAELLDAIRSLVHEGASEKEITDARLSDALYTRGMPDPDLIIRTSGEQRLSGFLLWQAAYAELVFSPKLWPEFSEADLDAAIEEYNRRDRRFGGR
jgi:undecaprenyl diphosphate synthase